MSNSETLVGHKYAVVGGAGAMGRITVRDLFETCSSKDTLVIADYDLAKAEALARDLAALPRAKTGKAPKLEAVRINVKDPQSAAQALHGTFVLLNSVQYQMNLDVMEVALKVGAHYVDLGGLFHVTRKQLELDKRFKAINRIAVVGMGAAPGITNLLSRLGADQLDTVTEIHTRVGSMDETKYEPKQALAVAYSLKTILEEFSYEPAVFTKGKFTFVKPMSGDHPHTFPKPIGVRRPMYTIHSEVATLPTSYIPKGVKEVSFKIAFDPEFVDRVRFLRDLGMASHEPIEVAGGKVAPVDVVNKVAMSQPPTKQVGKLKQYEVVRAVVKGTVKGKKVTIVSDCHTAGMPAWGIGLDIDTGSPPAVAAQMLAYGEITGSGVQPPELCIEPKQFFKRLKIRKMRVVSTKKTGWGFKV